MLIHGTVDTDVPYAESKSMAAKLAESNVKHEFITVQGVGHGLTGVKPDKLNGIAEQAAEFIKTHATWCKLSSIESSSTNEAQAKSKGANDEN